MPNGFVHNHNDDYEDIGNDEEERTQPCVTCNLSIFPECSIQSLTLQHKTFNKN